MEISIADILPDITYKVSRSGGRGGQNVNKVASKVELNFHLYSSSYFNEEQKALIREKLGARLIAGDKLQVICEEERSQFLNKERCLEKLVVLLKNALHVRKPRKATKRKRSAVEERLKDKRLMAMKKLYRKKQF